MTGKLVLAFKYLKLFVTDMIGLFLTDVGQQVTYNSLNSRNDFFFKLFARRSEFHEALSIFLCCVTLEVSAEVTRKQYDLQNKMETYSSTIYAKNKFF